MQKLFIFIAISLTNWMHAQSKSTGSSFERNGFIVGFGLGAGTLTLLTNDTVSVNFSSSLPNIKLGYMVTNRFAIAALLPGATYSYLGKDRSFEGIMATGQYWIKDKWWVLAGGGMTFDAPAFYTVKDPKTAGFHTGFPALTFATGYELYHHKKFAVDLQYRIFMGQAALPNNGKRQGLSNVFILGFNWY